MKCDVISKCVQEIRDRLLISDDAEITLKCKKNPQTCQRRKRLLREGETDANPD